MTRVQLVEPRQLLEAIAIQRVEADRDPVQARALELLGCAFSSTPLVVIAEIADAVAAGEPGHQVRDVAAEQRLAAGQPNLVDAEVEEQVDQLLDFLEVQDVLARQPEVLLFGHAVPAAQVAPVGDREAQVPERPAVDVGNRHLLRS